MSTISWILLKQGRSRKFPGKVCLFWDYFFNSLHATALKPKEGFSARAGDGIVTLNLNPPSCSEYVTLHIKCCLVYSVCCCNASFTNFLTQLCMEIHGVFFPSKFQVYMLFYTEKDNCKIIIRFLVKT